MLPERRRTLLAILSLLCAPRLGAVELPRITVSVPGPGAASYLPVDLIARTGIDHAEGFDLRVRHVAGGGLAIEDLLTGNADFAVLGLPAAMSARLKDPRIVALAAINDLPLYVLLVRSQLAGKVRQVADLRGRTIGVHSNSITTKTNSHQLLELLLRQAGVATDSVRYVPVGQRWSSEMEMLASGAADAIMGDEPHASRMIERRIAYPLLHLGDPRAAEAIPGGAFLRGVLVGRSDRIAGSERKTETMVRMVRRTLEWIATHKPEEIVELAAIEDPDERRHFLEVLRRYPRQYSKDGRFSTRQLHETERFFRESQADNQAAKAMTVESMVSDRWAGRKD